MIKICWTLWIRFYFCYNRFRP